MDKRLEEARAALKRFLAIQGTRPQRTLARAAPTLLDRMTAQCAVHCGTDAFPEDAAASALASVNARLAANADPLRAQAVRHWLWNSERLLYPLCEAACLALKGGKTPLETVARRILDEVATLPPDKIGLLWRFGLCTICAHRGEPLERIIAVLGQPRRRRREKLEADGVDVQEIERLAQRPDAKPAPRPPIVVIHRECRWVPASFQKAEDAERPRNSGGGA